MFRKRDSDSIEREAEIELGNKPKPKPDVQFERDARPEPPRIKPEPPEIKSEPDARPEPKTSPEPDVTSTSSDDAPSRTHTPNDSDLPESQPLSAAPKSAAASISPTASSDPQANKRLIVGQGIRLSGEINSCDRLVVEGEVEVTLNDTLALEITSSGRFTGGCEVEEADISGIYEGDLTVRNTLFVRGTGRITGTIRYGQLELERGGQIAGNISVLGNESGGSTANDGAKVRSAKAPLFGGSSG